MPPPSRSPWPGASDTVLRMQVERYRAMSPERKLAAVQGMLRSAWALAEAGVLLRAPHLTPAERATMTREVFRRGPA